MNTEQTNLFQVAYQTDSALYNRLTDTRLNGNLDEAKRLYALGDVDIHAMADEELETLHDAIVTELAGREHKNP